MDKLMSQELEKLFDANAKHFSTEWNKELMNKETFVRVVGELMPKWISVDERLPEKRDCDKNSPSGFSNPIIVSDGHSVWDDAMAVFSEEETTYWIHRFGYDNDSYEVKKIAHWMPLPEPPTK